MVRAALPQRHRRPGPPRRARRLDRNGSTCSFWLEYDRSTEPAHRVAGKLDGYAALHRATGTTQTILFILTTPAREASLRTRLARHPAITTGAVTAATTAEPCPHPADPVWAPIGAVGRIRLAHIRAPDY